MDVIQNVEITQYGRCLCLGHVCAQERKGSESSSTSHFHMMKISYYCHISIVLNLCVYCIIYIYIYLVTLAFVLPYFSNLDICVHMYVCVCVSAIPSVMSDSLQPFGLQPTRLLCPWDSPTRILQWVAKPTSRGSSQLRNRTQVSYVSCIGRWVLYHQRHLGSPYVCIHTCIFIFYNCL